MANLFEGLCYLINTADTTGDASLSEDERLTPRQQFDKFLSFVRDGKPKEEGGFELSDDGREIRGVLDWLLPIPVRDASFFATEPADDGTMVVVTLANTNVPWIDILGFMDFVKVGSPINVADENGQIKLAELPQLGEELRRRAGLFQAAVEMLPPERLPQLKEALSGAEPPGLHGVIADLEEPVRSQVSDLFDSW